MVSTRTVRCRWCYAPGLPPPSQGSRPRRLAGCRDCRRLKAQLHIQPRVPACSGSELDAQARGQPCPAPGAPLTLRQACCIHGARAGVPWLERCRRPGSAGSCRVTMTLLSGLWLPLAVAGLTSFYRVVQQAGGREGRMVSWGAELEPQNLILGCF